MKEDLIALKRRLQGEEKYRNVYFHDGNLVNYNNSRPLIKEEILSNKDLKGEYKALKYFESVLNDIIRELSAYSIDFEEIITGIFPSYFMSEKNICDYNKSKASSKKFNPDLIFPEVVAVKFDFNVIYEGRSMKSRSVTPYHTAQDYITTYLTRLNQQSEQFYVNFEKLAQMMNDHGYKLSINTNSELFESQKSDRFPVTNINFTKQDNKVESPKS